MIKVDYSYSVNLELAGIGNPTLNVCGKYECSSSDDNTLKGEIAIEILKSLHNQGVLRFVSATFQDNDKENAIEII